MEDGIFEGADSFLFIIDLNKISYPTYIPLRITLQLKELESTPNVVQLEQVLSNFLQSSNFISRNQLFTILSKYNGEFDFFFDDINNYIIDQLENCFGNLFNSASHFLVWRGKGATQYYYLRSELDELCKLYQCDVIQCTPDEAIKYLTEDIQENLMDSLEEEIDDDYGLDPKPNPIWPEKNIDYEIELAEQIQAEIDFEDQSNIWLHYKNMEIHTEDDVELGKLEEQMENKMKIENEVVDKTFHFQNEILEHKEKLENLPDKIYIRKNIINSQNVLELYKNNYNIFKLLELIRKHYDKNIYIKACTLLKDYYITKRKERICMLLIKLIPLEILNEDNIIEGIDILKGSYKLNTWKKVWNDIVRNIIKKIENKYYEVKEVRIQLMEEGKMEYLKSKTKDQPNWRKIPKKKRPK